MTDEYDPTRRQAEPADDDNQVERIEIEFAIPVYISQEQQRKLHGILSEICRSPVNQPVGGVHWLAGWGSKPQWSRMDSLFLGKAPDPDAPDTGEPTFDSSVLHGESCARAK